MAAALRNYSFTNSLGSGFTSSSGSPAALRLHRLAWQWFYGPSASPTHLADLQLGFRSCFATLQLHTETLQLFGFNPSLSKDFVAPPASPARLFGLTVRLFAWLMLCTSSSSLDLAVLSPSFAERVGGWELCVCLGYTLSFLCNAFCHDLFNTSAAPLYLVLPVGSSSLPSVAWLARGALGS